MALLNRPMTKDELDAIMKAWPSMPMPPIPWTPPLAWKRGGSDSEWIGDGARLGRAEGWLNSGAAVHPIPFRTFLYKSLL